MAEEIIVYDAKTGQPINSKSKKDAHMEQKKAFDNKESAPHIHKHIGVMLLDMDGNLLSTIRDYEASTNPDMIDKSLGGHISAGYDKATAILKVASREFKIPTAIIDEPDELRNIIFNHPELLKHQAFITRIGYEPDSISVRKTKDGETWDERCEQHYYAGVYDGLYSCSKGSGIRQWEWTKLKKYAEKNPDRVTADIINIIKDYDNGILDLIKTVNDSRNLERKDIAEIVQLYDLNGGWNSTAIRKEVHKPIMKAFLEKKPQEFKHSHIGGMLVGKNGEIYVQIRAEDKAENPGMYDKLVGGHIPAGDSPIGAAYHEFIEEMAIPIGLYRDSIWENILRNIPEVTQHQAICLEPILESNFVSHRVRRNGESFDEICDQYFVTGYYTGSFKFIDQEAAGVYQFPSRESLKSEIDEHPDKFTTDLKYMVKKFWNELQPLQERFRKAS